VQSLVRQMRGTVVVRGRQPPPGTVFEVELPAASPTAVAGDPQAAPFSGPAPLV